MEATVEISGTGLSRVGGFSDGTRTLTGSESHHYVIGLPTANMPTTGDFTYDLLGSTPPTYGDGTGIGTLNNASLTAHFDGTTPTVDINMQFSIGGTTPEVYNTSATASISGSQFGASGFLTTDQFSGSYNTLIKGFFAGDQAARAGYVYHVDTSEQVNGAVTFTKGAEVPLSAVTATD